MEEHEKQNVNAIRYFSVCLIPVLLLAFLLPIGNMLEVFEYDISDAVVWVFFGTQLFLIFSLLILFHSGQRILDEKTQFLCVILLFLIAIIPCIVLGVGAFPLLLLPVMYTVHSMRQISISKVCVAALAAMPLCLLLRRELALFLTLPNETEYDKLLKTIVPACFITFSILSALYYSSAFYIRSLKYQRNLFLLNAKDSMLNVLNKTQFLMEMKRLLDTNDKEYLLVYTNIQNYRLFNEFFGHEAGDELLRRMAVYLSEYIGSNGLTGRSDGDHLLALIEKDKFDEESFNDQFLNNHKIIGNYFYQVEIVCGVYEIEDRRLASPIMCDRAMIACQQGKKGSRKLIYYQEEMSFQNRRTQQMLESIHIALDQHQFIPYVQPQCNKDGWLVGGEVLVRWLHPDFGIIMPGEFVPVCEASGLISKLDRIVWEFACQAIRSWTDRGLPLIPLSVNISPIDLFELDVLEELKQLTRQYGVRPAQLHLEITETTMMENAEFLLPIVKSMREAGFCVEIDDFGSGYSSLGVLTELEVDVIKLDLSFVQRMDKSPKAEMILRMMAELIRSMGIESIIEGVEKKEQLDKLIQMGYSYFQGWYFSKPISMPDFEKKYLIAAKRGERAIEQERSDNRLHAVCYR